VLSIWYYTDCTEKNATSNSSVVACVFFAAGRCLPSGCVALLGRMLIYSKVLPVSLHGKLLMVLASIFVRGLGPRGTHDPYFCASRRSGLFRFRLNCCFPSPARSFLTPGLTGPMTTFLCHEPGLINCWQPSPMQQFFISGPWDPWSVCLFFPKPFTCVLLLRLHF
jgi:hypothetical protein